MGQNEYLTLGRIGGSCTEFDTRMPMRLERGGLFLCLRGHADIVVNMKHYRINMGDLLVAFPYTIVQVLDRSDDFGGNVIGTEIDFFSSIQINDKPSYYLYLRENPCISLIEAEWTKIVSLHDQLARESSDTAHPLRREIDDCMLRMIAYEVAAIYIKRKPIEQQPRTRNEIIFVEFIYTLFNNFQTHRSVEYYASKQSITSRHLSMVIKQQSGMTASEWIVSCTIATIKTRLQNNCLSIIEISEELNFPNPSFFAQYFKKQVGLSPKDFRKSMW